MRYKSTSGNLYIDQENIAVRRLKGTVGAK